MRNEVGINNVIMIFPANEKLKEKKKTERDDDRQSICRTHQNLTRTGFTVS